MNESSAPFSVCGCVSRHDLYIFFFCKSLFSVVVFPGLICTFFFSVNLCFLFGGLKTERVTGLVSVLSPYSLLVRFCYLLS